MNDYERDRLEKIWKHGDAPEPPPFKGNTRTTWTLGEIGVHGPEPDEWIYCTAYANLGDME
jgi:hypothetical protein